MFADDQGWKWIGNVVRELYENFLKKYRYRTKISGLYFHDIQLKPEGYR